MRPTQFIDFTVPNGYTLLEPPQNFKEGIGFEPLTKPYVQYFNWYLNELSYYQIQNYFKYQYNTLIDASYEKADYNTINDTVDNITDGEHINIYSPTFTNDTVIINQNNIILNFADVITMDTSNDYFIRINGNNNTIRFIDFTIDVSLNTFILINGNNNTIYGNITATDKSIIKLISITSNTYGNTIELHIEDPNKVINNNIIDVSGNNYISITNI